MKSLYIATLVLFAVFGVFVSAAWSLTTPGVNAPGGINASGDLPYPGRQQAGPYATLQNGTQGQFGDRAFGHGNQGITSPSGLPPVGESSVCMGGAGGTDSGATASGMGAC